MGAISCGVQGYGLTLSYTIGNVDESKRCVTVTINSYTLSTTSTTTLSTFYKPYRYGYGFDNGGNFNSSYSHSGEMNFNLGVKSSKTFGSSVSKTYYYDDAGNLQGDPYIDYRFLNPETLESLATPHFSHRSYHVADEMRKKISDIRVAKVTSLKKNWVDSSTISVHFEVDVSIDKSEYSIDNGGWVSTGLSGSERDFECHGLTPNKRHSIKIRVRRKDNQRTSESSVLEFDTLKPSAPSNGIISIDNIGIHDVTFSWNGFNAASNASISEYHVKVSADGIGDPVSTTKTSYTWSGLNSNTDYRIYIKAIDNYGTESSWVSKDFKTIGLPPVIGSVKTPTTSLLDETIKTINISWTKASSYNGACDYYIYVSENGKDYRELTHVEGINTINTTVALPNTAPGNTYQFQLWAKNDVGWSKPAYSGKITLNDLNPPIISDIPIFNPFLGRKLIVNLSGGSQSNGKGFVRGCALYFRDKWLWETNYSSLHLDNSSVEINVSPDIYLSQLGTNKSASEEFKIVYWTENEKHSRSEYRTAYFSVNINTDGGANPVIKPIILTGGYDKYVNTCFIKNYSVMHGILPNAELRRYNKGTTVKYSIKIDELNRWWDGQTFSMDCTLAGIYVIKCTVTDSRGLTSTSYTKVNVQDYNMPSIKDLKLYRQAENTSNGVLTYSIYYSPIYAYDQGVDIKGAQLNGVAEQKYLLDSATEWMNASNNLIINNLKNEIIYHLQLRVADKLYSKDYVYDSTILETLKVGFAIRKNRIGINCIPQEKYALDVVGDTNIHGDLFFNGIRFKPSNDKQNLLINSDFIVYENSIRGLYMSHREYFVDNNWNCFADGWFIRATNNTSEYNVNLEFNKENKGGIIFKIADEYEIQQRIYDYPLLSPLDNKKATLCYSFNGVPHYESIIISATNSLGGGFYVISKKFKVKANDTLEYMDLFIGESPAPHIKEPIYQTEFKCLSRKEIVSSEAFVGVITETNKVELRCTVSSKVQGILNVDQFFNPMLPGRGGSILYYPKSNGSQGLQMIQVESMEGSLKSSNLCILQLTLSTAVPPEDIGSICYLNEMDVVIYESI